MFTTTIPRRAARRAPTPEARRLAAALAMLAALYGARALAYETYSQNRDFTNCGTCHGDFKGSPPYYSMTDSAEWIDPTTSNSVNLHDGHRYYMLNGDCDVCHSAGPRFPVRIGSSVGGAGLPPIGCAGCHGRPEPAAGGTVKGAGLRQHHFRRGEPICVTCHADAAPDAYVPADEHTFPPYYATPDAAHPDKPANPCNLGGSEGAIAPPRGLDNDGNAAYDGDEPGCSPTPSRAWTWGRVKVRYR